MTARGTKPRRGSSQLSSQIIESLRREPLRSVDSLVEELKFHEHTIRTRLVCMELAGEARSTEVRGKTAFARVKLWEILDAQPKPRADHQRDVGGMPRQTTTQNYSPIGGRDPLVAALFGPAGSQP